MSPDIFKYKLFTISLVMMVHLICLPGILSASDARLTLRTCIEQGLKNHPSIRVVRENITAGRSRESQISSSYFPHINASTGYTESHSLGGAFGDTITKSYTTTLSANQLIYDFGKTGHAQEGARSSTLSLELESRRVVQEVIFNIKEAYYALLQAKKLVIVAQKTLEQAESHLKQAEVFFHAGSKPKFDVTRAEVEVNSARLGLINAGNNVRIRTIMLSNAMGMDLGNAVDIEDVLGSPVILPKMEEARSEAMKNRPEMLKAFADIDAARSRVQTEEATYFPTISASGAYNWAQGTAEMGMFKGDIQNSWNAGIMLSVPLFEGGLTRGKVNEARANLRALEAQGDAFMQAVRLEVDQAYADLESAAMRVGVMESSLNKARENLDIAQGRYEAGIGPYIEVTDAQLSAVQAETDHVQAQYDHQLAVAKLYKAMGRTEP